MLNILKKYYLPPFAGILVANAIKTFTTSSNHTFQHRLMLVSVTTIALTLVIGTGYYLQDTKWGPKKRNKMFDKKPFTDLLMNRFILKDNVATGIISGYTVIVSYIWPKGNSAIVVNVLFDPDFNTRYKSDLEYIKERNKITGPLPQSYTWNNGAVSYILSYNFTPPAYDEIMNTAERMISILKKEGLPPMGYEESERPILSTDNVASIGLV